MSKFASVEVRWVNEENVTTHRVRLNGRLQAFRGDKFEEEVVLDRAARKGAIQELLEACKENQERLTHMLERLDEPQSDAPEWLSKATPKGGGAEKPQDAKAPKKGPKAIPKT